MLREQSDKNKDVFWNILVHSSWRYKALFMTLSWSMNVQHLYPFKKTFSENVENQQFSRGEANKNRLQKTPESSKSENSEKVSI